MNCQDVVLATLLNKIPSTTLTLRLFSNYHNPSDTTSKNDLIEVSGNGYSPVKLVSRKWAINNGVAEYTPVEFVFTGAAGKIMGYYLTKDGSDDVMVAQRFKETIEITAPSQKVIITPKLKR
jgi:hypothetical protein